MYGETGAEMRQHLAALLRQHRVQQRLGGPTREAREELGVLVREYRQNLLAWLSQAMRAASPLAFSNLPSVQPNPFRSVGTACPQVAAGELARAIDHARAESSASIASAEALATPLANPTVDHWRLAARAAAMAEHDTSDQFAVQMTANHAQALVGDVAALTQAIVVLDQRYKNTPGWEPLAQSARLGWAALAAALDVNLGQPDYAVDHLGWRPKTKLMPDPARPGILGVLQAQHNLVVRMKSVPNATNLRLVVDSQRLVSAHLAPFAARIDERLAQRWTERAETYSVVLQELREVGGLLGRGGLAVAEGLNAVTRLRSLPRTPSSNHASCPASSFSSTDSTTASQTSSKTVSNVARSSSASPSPASSTAADSSSARSANASYPSPGPRTLRSSAPSESASGPRNRCRQPHRDRHESTSTPP